MNRLHRALRWLRLEDENGELSLTTIAFGVGCFCLIAGKQIDLAQLAPFALALGAHVHRRAQRQHKVELAMEGAQEAATLQMQQTHELAKSAQGAKVEELAAKVDTLIDKVLTVTSPERLQGIQKAFSKKPAA